MTTETAKITQNTPFRIGKVEVAGNLVLAPMCGVTDLATRRVSRKEGASVCFTEMVSSVALMHDSKKTFDILRTAADDSPLAVQVFGGDPETLAKACRILEGLGTKWIDLNMGCPVPKVANHEAGSGLLKDLALIGRIFGSMRKAVSGTFTCKIRAGWDANSLVFTEVVRIANEEGLDALAFHPRTRAQQYTGKANWDYLRDARSISKIPVFGSGDLFSPTDVLAMKKHTDVNGCYLARGAQGNPWIFRRAAALLRGEPDPGRPKVGEIRQTVMEHLDGSCSLYGEDRGVRMFRKHIGWYTKGLRNSAQLRAKAFNFTRQTDVQQTLTEYFDSLEASVENPWSGTARQTDDTPPVETPEDCLAYVQES